MPPTKKTASKPVKSAAPATPPPASPAEPTQPEPTPDTYAAPEPATPAAGDLVRYDLNGASGHGVVVDQVDGDTDREPAVTVIPLPETITVPVSALVTDDTED